MTVRALFSMGVNVLSGIYHQIKHSPQSLVTYLVSIYVASESTVNIQYQSTY